MSLPEVCAVWIDQQIDEALARKGDTGESYREIGRIISAEIEKRFETKVNPGTILTRVARTAKGVSNETLEPSNGNDMKNVMLTKQNAAQRPLCVCGNLAKIYRTKKDGTKTYAHQCNSCLRKKKRMKPQQQNGVDYDSAQEKVWSECLEKIENLIEFIKINLLLYTNVNQSFKIDVRESMDTLNTLIKIHLNGGLNHGKAKQGSR